jgi:AraC-like DNA-binding protein
MSRLTWFHVDTRFGAGDWNCDSEDTAPGATEASSRPAVAFTRRGAYRLHVGSKSSLVGPGTVVSYPQWMEYRISHPLPGGDRSLVVSLTGDGLETLGVERLSMKQIASSRRMALLVREVEIATRDAAGLAVEERLVQLMREAVTALASDARHLPTSNATAAAHHRAVERAKDTMMRRYAERLTLDDIARDSGYSAAHLCELFPRETGFTIHRYLNRLRLLIALESLDGPWNLTRLASEVGFSTPSHFSTAFRRELGSPPSRLITALRRCDVARLRR